jgi:hypothetical protein
MRGRRRERAEPPRPEAGAASLNLDRAGSAGSRVQVGLIATPALDADAVAEVADELAAVLAERFPGVDWDVVAIRKSLLPPPAAMTELVDATRRHLLDQDWDLAVAVTELPLRLARRPLVKHSSPTHRVGLVSLPALGARRVRQRLLDSLGDVVASLVGEGDEPAGTQRRLVEIASDVEGADDLGPVFVARVVSGNIGLLLGMIRSNHPWRFATRLSRALSGAIAAGAFALVTTDVWRISDGLGAGRLAAVSVVTVVLATITLIGVHGLWERANDPRVREQVALFNVVTAITVSFGVLSLYVALVVLSLAGAALVIDSSLFTAIVQHHAGAGDYLRLAWFTGSLATVGGALGGTLESDRTVREAAYAYRGEEELALNGN